MIRTCFATVVLCGLVALGCRSRETSSSAPPDAPAPSASTPRADGFFEGEIESESRFGDRPPERSVQVVKGHMSRKESSGGASLVDARAKKAYLLDAAKKTYRELDFGDIVPLLDGGRPTPVPSVPTGKRDTVAGRPCEIWRLPHPKGSATEICYGTDLRSGALAAPDAAAVDAGYPLRMIGFDSSGREVGRTIVTRVEEKRIDDALVTIPPDYRREAESR